MNNDKRLTMYYNSYGSAFMYVRLKIYIIRQVQLFLGSRERQGGREREERKEKREEKEGGGEREGKRVGERQSEREEGDMTELRIDLRFPESGSHEFFFFTKLPLAQFLCEALWLIHDVV